MAGRGLLSRRRHGGLDPEEVGFTPQPMVRWLGPRGLSATAMQVLLSTIFGAYSDKREIQAALKAPTASDLSDRDELWFDFMADTGDGFNPTFTTASLLGRDHLELEVDGRPLVTERGELLVLGGDLAYPAATPTQFRERFIGPMGLALPAAAAGDDPPTLVACAGNHDWYDGLTTFLRLFCDGHRIGGWRTEQTRSYFAVELPHRWWVVGIDLSFDFFIDSPQMEYFRTLATERIRPGDRVILVTHRPSWLFRDIGEKRLYTHGSTANLQQFERDVFHDNDIEVPLVLAGDIHHYNRYVSDEGQHRVTAGAGGTFLHPTNHLRTSFDWPTRDGTTTFHQEALYPDAPTSRRLRWGTLLAPFKNPSFVAFVGAVYVLFALSVRFAIPGAATGGLNQALSDSEPREVAAAIFDAPVSFLLAVGLLAVFVVFADAGTRLRRALLGGFHWLLHLTLMVVVIWGVARLVVDLPYWGIELVWGFLELTITLDTIALVAGIAVVGGYLASQLFATYLFACFTLFRRHATHAFSAQRLEGYRCFLRMRIDADGGLTVFPVGVRKVPRRWRGTTAAGGAPGAEPVDHAIEPALIEAPIRIGARTASPTPPR